MSIKTLSINRTIFSTIIAGVIFAFTSVGVTRAQQQTTGGLSPTRNPQQSQTDLFQQNNDVQNSTGSEALNSQGKINIPAGQPAALDSDSAESNSSSNWMIGLVIFAVIVTFTLIVYAMKQYEGPDSKPIDDAPEDLVQTPVLAKKPATKKKKRRTQTKKKKR